MGLNAPETLRWILPKAHPLYSDSSAGSNGAFRVPVENKRGKEIYVKVICSDGEGWEHVSASHEHRTPTWDEMCQIKALFWEPEDAVVQYHPPASQYVNFHPYCLHLWRPKSQEIPLPPSYMVGPE